MTVRVAPSRWHELRLIEPDQSESAFNFFGAETASEEHAVFVEHQLKLCESKRILVSVGAFVIRLAETIEKKLFMKNRIFTVTILAVALLLSLADTSMAVPP